MASSNYHALIMANAVDSIRIAKIFAIHISFLTWSFDTEAKWVLYFLISQSNHIIALRNFNHKMFSYSQLSLNLIYYLYL